MMLLMSMGLAWGAALAAAADPLLALVWLMALTVVRRADELSAGTPLPRSRCDLEAPLQMHSISAVDAMRRECEWVLKAARRQKRSRLLCFGFGQLF
jgi:hypothetical protein